MPQTTIIFDCPLPPWLVGIAGGLILLVALVFVWRDVAAQQRWVRRLLIALTTAAALMLLGLLLSPKLVRTWPDPHKPRCLVLVDGSRSMLLADKYSGVLDVWLHQGQTAEESAADLTRESIVRRLLTKEAPTWLAPLSQRFDVSVARFSETLEGAGEADGAGAYRVDPEGYGTALGEVLDQAASAAGGLRPRALVVISDGGWNTGRDPSDVARVQGRTGLPVFTVGVGNPVPQQDLAVLSVEGPKECFVGDEIVLRALVASTAGSVRVPVELLCDGEVIRGPKEVVTQPGGRPTPVTFTYVPEKPERRLFTVRIVQPAGEKVSPNKSSSLAVEVVERKIHVLLVESEPRWEFRFLRNVLERDPAAELKVFLARPGLGPSTGPGYLAELPTDKKGLGAFEVVVLGDIAAGALPEEFLKELSELVRRRGAALVIMAGRKENYRSLRGTPLDPLLPVTFDNPAGITGVSRQLFRPAPTQEGMSHLLTRLAPTPEANEDIWSRLPAMRWSADVGGLRPGAVALLSHPDRFIGGQRMPILAVQRVGEGSVLFSGVEETYLWRRGVGDPYHYRFWAQALRWLAKKRFSEGDSRARLSVDRTEANVGEAVEVEAYCLNQDGFPLENAQAAVRISDAAGGAAEDVALAPVPGGWGLYRATYHPTRAGAFKLAPLVALYGKDPLPANVTVNVTRRDLEKNSLAQDAAELSAIAEAGGGKFLQPNEVSQLPALLAARAEILPPLVAEFAPFRHWLFYLTLAAILSLAWFLRKRSGLA